MTKIIDGLELANKKLDQLKNQLSTSLKKPKLAILIIGKDSASQIYVENKIKASEKIGILTEIIKFDHSVTTDELVMKIEELNIDKSITGIIIQMPIPKHIDLFRAINTIDPKKDVDGFHPINVGNLYVGSEPYFVPCTPLGVLDLIEEECKVISGLHVVIVGRSNIVGRPLASLLLKRDMTVTICHSKTKNLDKITREADVVVLASGKSRYFDRKYFNKNAFVIDVGISRSDSGKVVGDADFDDLIGNVKAITKVPGGAGPMTVASLMENMVKSIL